jgi:chromosome segregation ATPase
MQGAHILNLGQEAPRNNTEPPRVEDELTETRDLIEQTQTDVRRTRVLLEQQQQEHESHQRRTKILTVVLAVLIAVLAVTWLLVYPTVRDRDESIAQMLGLRKATSALGERMESVEGGLNSVTTGLPVLIKNMNTLQDDMKSGLAAAQNQATQIGHRIQQDVNRTMQSVQSRIAGVESNQREAAERVNQLQGQVAGLQRELTAIRAEAVSSSETIKALREAQQTSTTELSGLNKKVATSQASLNTLNTRLDRKRIEFNLPGKQARSIAPGIHFTVRRIDGGKQEVDGTLQVGPDSRNVTIRAQGVQKPVVFYMSNESRPVELVFTQVSKKEISGYILMPTPSSE